jgi:putative zinc finger/helix-turn-helix YgiT family protein
MADQKITCEQCGNEMASQRENFLYKSCGLPNVTLESVVVNRCPKCGEYEVEIPGMDELHKQIAQEVIRKPQKLAPEEIRFLRSFLGWSGTDFAKRFDVDPATVSRWETGATRMGGVAERLLRLCVAHDKPISDYSSQALEEVAKEEAAPLKMGFRMGDDAHWQAAA